MTAYLAPLTPGPPGGPGGGRIRNRMLLRRRFRSFVRWGCLGFREGVVEDLGQRGPWVRFGRARGDATHESAKRMGGHANARAGLCGGDRPGHMWAALQCPLKYRPTGDLTLVCAAPILITPERQSRRARPNERTPQ